MTTEFKEVQKFDQWWLQFFLVAAGGAALYMFYRQIILGFPVGDNPMSDTGLIIFTVFAFCFIGFIYMLTLKTHITSEKISVSYFPMINKEIQWTDIDTAEVVNYGFVGGWGIRIGTKYGTVYNVKGKEGLALRLKSGKKYVIGTQKAEELSHFIQNLDQIV